jgi:glucose-1-phosphate cytidylyltransferase
MTGGRLKRVQEYLKGEESFCFTYGDGVGNVDITALIEFHNRHGKLATLTATRPPGRYGALKFGENDIVENFQEKPDGDGSWINGGFFVLNPEVIDRITGDHISWEEEPLKGLATDGELAAFKHAGFWQPMDTLREKIMLNKLWSEEQAPWKIWE